MSRLVVVSWESIEYETIRSWDRSICSPVARISPVYFGFLDRQGLGRIEQILMISDRSPEGPSAADWDTWWRRA